MRESECESTGVSKKPTPKEEQEMTEEQRYQEALRPKALKTALAVPARPVKVNIAADGTRTVTS